MHMGCFSTSRGQLPFVKPFILTATRIHDQYFMSFPGIDPSVGLRYRAVLSEGTLKEWYTVADIAAIDRLHPGSSFVKSTGVWEKREETGRNR